MKRIIYVLLILLFAASCVFLGMYISNKENYDIENCWSKVERSFVNLDENSLVKYTNANIADDVKNKFNTIVNDLNISKVDKIEQSEIIVKSYAVLEQNNNSDSKYCIIRIFFDYTDTSSQSQSKFLYFYFYKTKGNAMLSEWSLFNIETEDSVTIK